MSTATDMLALYLDAEVAVLKGTSIRIGDRQLTRANLVEIVAARQNWQRQVNAENAAAAGQKGPLSVHVSDFSDGTSRGGFGDRGQFGWH
jgi:hypothetical protein